MTYFPGRAVTSHVRHSDVREWRTGVPQTVSVNSSHPAEPRTHLFRSHNTFIQMICYRQTLKALLDMYIRSEWEKLVIWRADSCVHLGGINVEIKVNFHSAAADLEQSRASLNLYGDATSFPLRSLEAKHFEMTMVLEFLDETFISPVWITLNYSYQHTNTWNYS